MKKFEKVEKTGIISTKFSLPCTPSVILGTELSFDTSEENQLSFFQNGYCFQWYRLHLLVFLAFKKQRLCKRNPIFKLNSFDLFLEKLIQTWKKM